MGIQDNARAALIIEQLEEGYLTDEEIKFEQPKIENTEFFTEDFNRNSYTYNESNPGNRTNSVAMSKLGNSAQTMAK